MTSESDVTGGRRPAIDMTQFFFHISDDPRSTKNYDLIAAPLQEHIICNHKLNQHYQSVLHHSPKMKRSIDNNELIKFFFRQSRSETSLFYCRNEKCKPRRGMEAKAYNQLPSKGYTNLRSHLRSCVVDNFEEVYLEHLNKAGGRLDNFYFSSTRDADVFRLLEWVVMRNQPIAEVDYPITKNILKVLLTCSK